MSKKRLYILRHGNAQASGYENDASRYLTELGIEEVKSTAKQFALKNEALDAVYVSPYLRAQQTAMEFVKAAHVNVPIHTADTITPSGRELDVALWLNDLPYQSVLLVTHQPFAYQLVDLLVDEPVPHSFSMETATIAAVEGDLFATACCQFRWAIKPQKASSCC